MNSHPPVQKSPLFEKSWICPWVVCNLFSLFCLCFAVFKTWLFLYSLTMYVSLETVSCTETHTCQPTQSAVLELEGVPPVLLHVDPQSTVPEVMVDCLHQLLTQWSGSLYIVSMQPQVLFLKKGEGLIHHTEQPVVTEVCSNLLLHHYDYCF